MARFRRAIFRRDHRHYQNNSLSEQNIEIKKQYTVVLKGHMILCQLVFPKGTKGGKWIFWQEDIFGHLIKLWSWLSTWSRIFLNVHRTTSGICFSMESKRRLIRILPNVDPTNLPILLMKQEAMVSELKTCY